MERQIKSDRSKEKACGGMESHFWPFSPIYAEEKKKRVTDGPTDQPMEKRTDGQTDGPTDKQTLL